jgi:hypothetical protein
MDITIGYILFNMLAILLYTLLIYVGFAMKIESLAAAGTILIFVVLLTILSDIGILPIVDVFLHNNIDPILNYKLVQT